MKRVSLILAVFIFASIASAALTPYSQNFESLNQADPAALTNDGWLVYGNVFGPDMAYWYGYGPYGAPNGGAAFSAIADGQGSPSQGLQQLSIYNDYNNGDHANGAYIEANVFQEMTVGAADVGSTWTFSFDYKLGNLEGSSTALAFIKTLNPNAGWATTNYITLDTTSAPVAWGSESISILIDPTLSGQILQIGFSSTATNYEGSGIFYDNVSFVPEPTTISLLALGGLLLRRKRK